MVGSCTLSDLIVSLVSVPWIHWFIMSVSWQWSWISIPGMRIQRHRHSHREDLIDHQRQHSDFIRPQTCGHMTNTDDHILFLPSTWPWLKLATGMYTQPQLLDFTGAYTFMDLCPSDIPAQILRLWPCNQSSAWVLTVSFLLCTPTWKFISKRIRKCTHTHPPAP